MSEIFSVEQQGEGFRLDRKLVHDWAKDILHDGDVRDREAREAVEFFDKISQFREQNEYIAGAVEQTYASELDNFIRTQMFDGILELSEGLEYYGDVSAVVYDNNTDQEKLIRINGLELSDSDSFQVSLRSSDGDLYEYKNFRELLMPDDIEY